MDKSGRLGKDSLVSQTYFAPSPMSLAEQCFLIFQGGGAKGITHLGALKALENANLKRIGAAGTSAGAIIAALTAVGYTADDIFDPHTGANILSKEV